MTLFDRLREGLSASADDLLAGDLDVGGEDMDEGVAAAVLVAITERPSPGVLLTVRCADMRTHAGQVAFPGGRIDQGEDACAAAVREAWEELSIDPASVRIAGSLPAYRTVTGFRVVPVVATIPADLPITPHDAEVADWFEAPLAHLLDSASHLRRSAMVAGTERHYYEIPWNGRRIWGATAAMLVNLSRQLRWT